MFSDTKFWRLIWKEYRTQRPLWLAMVIGTPLLQAGLILLRWCLDAFQQGPLRDDAWAGFIEMFPIFASLVYVLGSSATMFSVEHETGTFDFQRVLPANQPRVFWAKVGFAVVSSLLLMAILGIVTYGIFLRGDPNWARTVFSHLEFGLIDLFLWSILASLLIRHPLWSVLAACYLAPLPAQILGHYLMTGSQFTDPLRAELFYWICRIAFATLIAATDIVLGKLWFEDRLRLPHWRFRLKPDSAPSGPSDTDLPPYLGQRQIGWSRLLWLGWRDGRWVLGAILVWFGFQFFALKTANHWTELLLPGLTGSFVCGLFAFAPEQWRSRFRFMAERGCSPRSAWFSRQAIWLPPVLLMTVATLWLQSDNYALPYAPHSPPVDAARSRMMAALGPLFCYSAGQLAAMLIRSTAIAIAVSLALTIFGFMWGGLMTSWLAPTWWSVGSLPLIGLFATWLKANDWIEERRDRAARWRLALGLGVPIALLLATCATYRVVQIPVVQLPAEWGEPEDQPVPFTAAEKETLQIYRRALAQIEVGNQYFREFQSRLDRARQTYPELSDGERHQLVLDGIYQDWLNANVDAIPMLREAHSRPAVPLAVLQPEPAAVADDDSPAGADKAFLCFMLFLRHAEKTLKAGKLDETWQDIEMGLEVLRRYRLRASAANLIQHVRPHEYRLLDVVAEWGRHPDQSRQRIMTAIRRLEEIATSPQAALHEIHWHLILWKILLRSDERWKEFLTKHSNFSHRSWDDQASFWWRAWGWLPWETWRSERVLRRQTFIAVKLLENYKRRVDSNWTLPPTTLTEGIDFDSVSDPMTATTRLPRPLIYEHSVRSDFQGRIKRFRLTMLQLALAGWRREHVRYPESLAELAPTYFTEIPRDPHTDGPFVYFPRGVPEDVTEGSEGNSSFRIIVKKDVPFLVTFGDQSGTVRRSQLPDGSWEFTKDDGKRMDLSSALRSARV